jgi:hypothetical protein
VPYYFDVFPFVLTDFQPSIIFDSLPDLPIKNRRIVRLDILTLLSYSQFTWTFNYQPVPLTQKLMILGTRCFWYLFAFPGCVQHYSSHILGMPNVLLEGVRSIFGGVAFRNRRKNFCSIRLRTTPTHLACHISPSKCEKGWFAFMEGGWVFIEFLKASAFIKSVAKLLFKMRPDNYTRMIPFLDLAKIAINSTNQTGDQK